jgi:hypothetical protein
MSPHCSRRREIAMTQHTPVAEFDPLADINPRSRTFYRDSAAVAAYLIHGEGRRPAFGRCGLTAAIMHHAMQAARENRTASLAEVRQALLEASRKIRSCARNPFPSGGETFATPRPSTRAGEA